MPRKNRKKNHLDDHEDDDKYDLKIEKNDSILLNSTKEKKGKKKKKGLSIIENKISDEENEENDEVPEDDYNFMEAKNDLDSEKIRYAIDNYDNQKLENMGLPPNYVRLNKFLSEVREGGDDIKLDGINITVPGKELLKDTKLALANKKKYGLVGRNGIGKSVLLNHIANRQLNGIPKHLSILLVEQEVQGSDMSALNTVLECDKERSWLIAQKSIMEDEMDKGIGKKRYYTLDDIYDRLNHISSDQAVVKAKNIMRGLGFLEGDLDKPTNDFSGGWRMRISLARALFYQPDILILDEPTNHLDLYALIWLENYLIEEWNKTVIIASHERDFLNNVVDSIIHLYDQKLVEYHGGYDSFLKRLKEQNKSKEKSKPKSKGKKTNSKPNRESKPPRFDFPEPLPLNPPLLQFKDVKFGYSEDKILFDSLDFGIDMESRIGLVGPNGSGKSTIMNLIAGSIQPLDGEVIINRKMRMARFTQHHVEQLDLNMTGLQHIMKNHPNINFQEAYNHLARFGLTGDYPKKLIGNLSGGYKSRITFADLAFEPPQVLLLDEPSNHLDIETIDALIKSLKEFKGGIIMISHNTRLLSQVCDQIWIVKDRDVIEFNGGFEEYRHQIIKEICSEHL